MPRENDGPSPEEMDLQSKNGETEMNGQEFERQKLAAQKELKEMFDMEKTGDFRQAVDEDRIDDALAFLKHIEANRDRFPQYNDNWLKDRYQEIGQKELFEKFGMKKTADFQRALSEGRIDDAKTWLLYIGQNREKFPQYTDSWFDDRRKEMEQA